MNFPEDRKYAKSHEWVKIEGGVATVGLSDYAQASLTDIIFADLPAAGGHFDAGAEICSVESVKAVGYIYAPIAGAITEVNELLKKEPEKINQDPYGVAWLFKIKPDEPLKENNLLAAADYKAFTETL